ncbi:MAG: MgtC/SapB family protein [Alphaproteobacteria bacterium]|nr:MgtC/SapB family protein [Alphaproteobacteria bacterium]NCQ66644.1 MgtC/SapB family protein [Alphaproteobacteria bacterium]NCT06996.1 MgtC/SapB family protein [Alphaproteobacteria bacterium]
MTLIPDTISWQIQLFYVAHLAFAFLLGAVIGWERERAGKEAGIRTFGCISMGSAAFSILSPLLGFADNSRIAAQIVLGIGFLGSGLFVRTGDRPSGLTTAASLWVSAAVGMSVGFSLYFLAVGLAIITALSLHLPSVNAWMRVSKKKNRLHKARTVSKNQEDYQED